jgi:hypothetical protein
MSSPLALSGELHLYSYNSYGYNLDSLRIATYQHIREITCYKEDQPAIVRSERPQKLEGRVQSVEGNR